MKKNLLTTSKLKESVYHHLESLGYNIITVKEKEYEYKPEYKDTQVVIARFPDELGLENMEKLEFVQLTSTGIPAPLKEVLANRDVVVSNHPYGYNIPIGEWIVTKILEIYKKSRKIEKLQRERQWQVVYDIEELTGKKALFIGAGRIAQEGAKRLKAFDVECIGVNTDGRSVEPFDKCIPMKDLISYLPQSHIYINTLPFTQNTLGFLGEDFFSNAKEGSVFVNVSRGEVVQEKVMIEYADRFLGLALDVFEEEPLSKESPLWDLENVYISSHTSWVSPYSGERFQEVVKENLSAWMEGTEVKNIVDLSRGY